jgi:plastocyanin
LARRLYREIAQAARVVFLIAGVIGLTACSKTPAVPPPSDNTPAPPPASGGGASPSLVSGRTPAATNGFSAIVIFEPQAAGEMPAQTDVPYMDQVQQTFTPPMLLVRTGQPTEFRNNDDVLHNVRVREDETKLPAFNVAIPTGEKYTFSFPRDGFYDVGCDIHPGMSAQIVASSSPYAVLADAAGSFTIANVPNGPYTAVAYSGAKTIEKEINVVAGAAAVDLTTP